MINKPVNFAIVGCGHIGKRHAEMVQRNEEASLIAMMDIRPIEDVDCAKFEVPFYTDLETMLKEHPEIDVVNICSPNGMHASQSLLALNYRKHVVCEKPMGLSKANCEEVIFKALQLNKQVFCVMQNRYSPPSVWLKEMIDEKRLGEVFLVDINCYWNRDERYYKNGNWKGSKDLDGGTLFTQFSHFIDIMYWLFGDIENIAGRFADFNHKGITAFEDTGIVHFEFVNGGIGSLNYSTSIYDQNLESSMTIIGSKGSIKVGGQYMNNVE